MIRQSTLKRVHNYPYLGVTISDDLSWTNHVNKVKFKANRTLGMLHKNLWSCKISVNEVAYKSMVRLQLEYACAVWDPIF